MKKADIKVGEEYAYASRNDYHSWGAGRVRVIEHQPVKTGWPSYTTLPGVLVQFLDDNGEATDKEPVGVPNRTIRESWTSYVEEVEARRQRQAAFKAQDEAAQAKQAVINSAVMDEIQRRVPEFGQGYGKHFFLGEESFRNGKGTKIEISVEAMAELLGIEVPS